MKNFSLIFIPFFIFGCAGTNIMHDKKISEITKEQKFTHVKEWSAIKDNGRVNTDWIKTFNDPNLEKLIAESLENNKQIRSLKPQVDRANALLKKAASSLKPTVGLGGKFRNRDSELLSEVQRGGVRVSWELDVWGRLALAETSAKKNLLATQADYEFARQSLVASTAKAWYMLTTSKLQLDHAKSVVSLLEKDLKIIESKHLVGQVDKRDVLMANTNLSSAKNAYLKAEISYESSQRSLELLLGRYPGALISGQKSLSALPIPIPAGIPSQLIERRPDLIAAEQRVAAAFYKEKEAKLLHLPQFKFSIGASITNLTDAVTELIGGVFAPLYTGGAIESEVDNATAIQKQSIEEYAQKVLVAFKEVETALSLEEKFLMQEKYLQDVVLNNEKTLKLTKVEYDIGKIEYLNVSIAINRLVSSRISLLDIASKRIFNRINLHLALGGGFDLK